MSSGRENDTALSTADAEVTTVGHQVVCCMMFLIVVPHDLIPSFRKVDPDSTPDNHLSFGKDDLPGTPTSPAQFANYSPEKLYVPPAEPPHNTSKQIRFDQPTADFRM